MSSDQDWDHFFKLVDEFKRAFDNMGGSADLPRLKFRLREISAYDRYIAEKTGQIEEHLDILCSTRKCKAYPGGVEAVYQKIAIELLGNIRQRARLVRQGQTDGEVAPE